MKLPSADTIKKQFPVILSKWNTDQNRRKMPWKGEKDPYKIWLSEIILQQTRVDQGLAYYNRFIKKYPNVNSLAHAPETEVFKLWEGLGYYSRCRNLLATAKYISEEYLGVFPDTYDSILNLKGIGPYTAAAISSFAYSLPYAVVDGNVYRLLSRIFGIATPTDSTEGKKIFNTLAQDLIDKKNPGPYNQAIMDFGATICKPLAPLCNECVFKKLCCAYLSDQVDQLPVKSKKLAVKKKWFYYFLIRYKGKIAIRLRSQKAIWQGLYDFPLIETNGESTAADLFNHQNYQSWFNKIPEPGFISEVFRQQLSHQHISGRFIEIDANEKPSGDSDWIWISKSNIKKYPFPQFINQYLGSLK